MVLLDVPQVQQLVQEAIKQVGQPGVPPAILYATVATLVSAIGGLWVYFRAVSRNLEKAQNRLLEDQKVRIASLETQIKWFSEWKHAETSEELLKDRVEAQQRLLEQFREEQARATEHRFSHILEQNTAIVQAINQSTAAIKQAAMVDSSVSDALRALDVDMEMSLRVQEEIRKNLEDLRRALIKP